MSPAPSSSPRRRSQSKDSTALIERYRHELDHLFRLRRFGMHPGLDVIHALLSGLGRPEQSFPAVHVAGSKGKGSVAAMAAGILSAHGLRTGLYTSPHLQSYRERIQIDRTPIGRKGVVEGLDRIRPLAESLLTQGAIDQAPTFFETTTALAFDYFARERVDVAVVEVGMGGRLDATNSIRAPVGVITTIEYEHTEFLGTTLTAIAHEKAGILHPGMVGVIGEIKSEPLAEIDRCARDRGVPLAHWGRELRCEDRVLSERGQRFTIVTPGCHYEGVELPLFGIFQPANAAVAVASVERLFEATRRTPDPERVREGLAKTRWRGRIERTARGPDLFLDVAHTPESARGLAQSLAEIYPFAAAADNAILFGCLADKMVEPMLDALAPLAQTIVVTPVRSDRTASPDDLRRAALGRFPFIVRAPGSKEGLALARAATDRVGFTLVAGSDYLVGEILNDQEGRVEGEPDLSDPVTPISDGTAARARAAR
ncbi:MAG: folylpolyglutamate synthase/dihydrofolate synthase family protein [Thermoplasmata archaeon]